MSIVTPTVCVREGGQLLWPQVSPRDPTLVFVSCDRSGLYRSDNMFLSEDRRWDRNSRMLDQRVVRGSILFNVAFDPDVDKRVMNFNPTEGLMLSTDGGMGWWRYSPDPLCLSTTLRERLTSSGHAAIQGV